VRDLLHTDPHEIFARNIRLAFNVTEVFEHAVNDRARIEVAQAREDWIRRGRPEEHPLTDQYRAGIPNMVRGRLMRMLWTRAQVLRHTKYGHRLKMVRPDALRIPHELTFAEAFDPSARWRPAEHTRIR
jgi:hypothetical protein